MKLLIDTNIVLDVILERQPFYSNSIEVLCLTKELLKELFKIVSVASVTEQEIQKAMELEWKDFEDSVQYSVALLQEMNGIVTRNPSDYGDSEIPVWLPERVLELIN